MIAIVSDIHGNLPALQAVLNKIEHLGCERIISLGDITGYYAQPKECMDLLIAKGAVQLLGNHDYYLAEGISCPRSRTVSDLIYHQRKVLPAKHIEFLKTLESRYDEGECSFVHGGWVDPLDEYLYRVSEEKLPSGRKFCFSGHTHVQVLAEFDTKTYCNPGSVGQPRDGNPRAAFAVLSGESIELHRVEYDIDATVFAMRKAGFDDPRLWEGLYDGAQIGGRIDKVFIE